MMLKATNWLKKTVVFMEMDDDQGMLIQECVPF